MSLVFRFSTVQDVQPIVALVNAAYRGHNSTSGWTDEQHLLDGARLSAKQLEQQLQPANVHMLLAERHEQLLACMLLTHNKSSSYLGTFAVAPAAQGGGIGRQMLAHAELTANQQWGAVQMEMAVISQRQELIGYYQRRGYQVCAGVSDFPLDLDVGTPKVANLTVTRLVKPL